MLDSKVLPDVAVHETTEGGASPALRVPQKVPDT